MTISVRPRARLTAALLAAGVVAAGSPAVLATEHPMLPELSTVAVQPLSFITDALGSFGDVVSAGTWAVEIPVDALYSAPFLAVFSAASALQDPSLIGSLISYATQSYMNPSDDYEYYTFPWDFKVSVLEPLAHLLPSPLSDGIVDALNGAANNINAVLSGLPDPTPGLDQISDNQLNNFFGQVLYSAQLGGFAPVYALAQAVVWAGYQPAVVAASIEAALQNPADIPGLISNLVYTVLDPNDGLLGVVALPFVNAASYAPPPIGYSTDDDQGIALNLYNAFSTTLTGVLNTVLPTPVSPFSDAPQQASITTAVPGTADIPVSVELDTAPKTKLAVTTAESTAVDTDSSVGEPNVSAADDSQDATSSHVNDPSTSPTPHKVKAKASAGKDAASSDSSGGRHAKSRGGAAA